MLLAMVALKGDLVPVGEALPAAWVVDPTPTPRPRLVFDFMPLGAQKKRTSVFSKSRTSRTSVASRRATTKINRLLCLLVELVRLPVESVPVARVVNVLVNVLARV